MIPKRYSLLMSKT